MKRSTVFLLMLVCIVIVFMPTISNAMPVASDGSGKDVFLDGLVDWWKKLRN
jgi:hypothetical protein